MLAAMRRASSRVRSLAAGEELGRGPSPRHALEIRRRRASGRFPSWSDNAAREYVCKSVVPEE